MSISTAKNFDEDSQARELMNNEIYENFFVEASAGSGKTTSLVKRMVAMVSKGIDVSKICAITFTKAAAGEFKSRFSKALADKSKNHKDEEIRRLCSNALMNIDLCFMGTIDSFCNMIISEHPNEAGVPSSSSLLSDADIPTVYHKEFSRIINGEYGEVLRKKAELFRAFNYNADKLFVSSLISVAEVRHTDIVYPKPTSYDIDTTLSQEKITLISTLDKLINHPEVTYTSAKMKADKYGDMLRTLKQKFNKIKGSWNSNLSDVLYILKEFDGYRILSAPENIGIMNSVMFIPNVLKSGKISYYTLDLKNTDNAYSRLLEMKYSYSVDFIVSACNAVTDELKKNGSLSYFDYLLYLRDMLKNDAEKDGLLINHISKRHSYYLIDEFQDTNPLQSEIFFYLSAENPVADWSKCAPRKGSLFIVGDPKQSIYRFRSADVSSFIRVRSIFENGAGKVLRLSRNFRSSLSLKYWFNRVFSPLLPCDTQYQSKYYPIPAEAVEDESGDSFGGVFKYTVTNSKNNKVDACVKTARIILNLVHNPAFKIKDRSSGLLRELQYRDFMIITPQKSSLGVFKDVLGRLDIPVKIEGKIIFGDCPALVAVSEIMLAVSDINNTQALYCALKNPVFAVTDSELARLYAKGFRLGLYYDNSNALKDEEYIEKIISEFSSLASDSANLTPSALFCRILDDMKIIGDTGALNLDYCYFALELLRSAEASGAVSSAVDGAIFINDLIHNSSEERSLSLIKNADRVHIANLHKVKGLEAPVVILADPNIYRFPPEKRVTYGENGAETHIFRLEADNFSAVKTDLYPDLQQEEQVFLDAEQLRLLYVGATRAENALIVAEEVNSDGEKSLSSPWNPLLNYIKCDFFKAYGLSSAVPASKPVRSSVKAEQLYAEAEKSSVTGESESFDPCYALKKPSELKLKTKIAQSDTDDDYASTEPLTEKRYNSALMGTMVHKIMEILVTSRKTFSHEDITDIVCNQYQCTSKFIRARILKASEVMLSGGFEQKNGLPQDILKTLLNADEVLCEIPFAYKSPDENGNPVIWNGVIDVAFLSQGKWHIIDYKTNLDGDNLDMVYEAQLTAYKNAFLEISGISADAFIYHISL